MPELVKRFRKSVLAEAVSGRLTEEWREEHADTANSSELADSLRGAHESAGGHKTGNAAPSTEGAHTLHESEFPEGWSIIAMRDLVEPGRPITYGILKPGPEMEEGVPYVRVADFPSDRLNLKSIRKTTKAIDDDFKRSRLRPGDILLSIRGTYGRVVAVPKELDGANITQDTARLSIQRLALATYVIWFLRSEIAQTCMQRSAKGVAVRGVNIGDVREMQVPLPSFPEQREIVRRVDELFARADALDARLAEARKLAERLEPSILAKAFRGELSEQVPEEAVEWERKLAEIEKAAGDLRERAIPRRGMKVKAMERAPESAAAVVSEKQRPGRPRKVR